MNNDNSMHVILITGSKGQLGQELQGLSYTHAWKGYRFIHTDIDTLDITNAALVEPFFRSNRVDFVINCAAYTAVDKAESEPEVAMLVNDRAVELLVGCCAGSNTPIMHVSTDYVFDGNSSVPYREEDPANPVSVYGKSKLEGERKVLGYKHGTVVRSSWLYSPSGKNFFNTILTLAAEKDHLNVVYDQVGTPTYARDLSRVVLLLVDSYLSGKNTDIAGLFHYSNEGVCSWYDFALEIVRLKGSHCRINPIETSQYPLPAKRPHFSVLNKTKIKSALSLTIPHWRESLITCIGQLD
jgi:dTDP-4-dehydrorhamnose reductase